MDYEKLIERQRAYFASGATRAPENRRRVLEDLHRALRTFEDRLNEALRADLNRQPYESYMTELSAVYGELRYFEKHLKSLTKEKSGGRLWGFAAGAAVTPEPYGVTLIVTPWNYPVNLCLMPLIGAVAAGNCAVVKLSAKSRHTSKVLAELLASVFPEEYVTAVTEPREACGDIFRRRWDYIFFTGSKAAGRQVMSAAAENLVPVTLELGGKNPVIIDRTADLRSAARRVAFGKCVNAGQTCVAPDYALIHESVRDAFVQEYEKALKKYFHKGDMSQMAAIVTDGHFRRLMGLLEGENAVIGGEANPDRRFIPPTVLTDVTPESPIMEEEVFGPVLPLISYTDIDWCIDYIRGRDKPLALYLFTKDKELQRRVLAECSFGGGCVNDTMLQAMGNKYAFGGVGASGMGRYHGQKSFETFTHYRTVVKRGGWPEQKLRYFPYGKMKFSLLRLAYGRHVPSKKEKPAGPAAVSEEETAAEVFDGAVDGAVMDPAGEPVFDETPDMEEPAAGEVSGALEEALGEILGEPAGEAAPEPETEPEPEMTPEPEREPAPEPGPAPAPEPEEQD